MPRQDRGVNRKAIVEFVKDFTDEKGYSPSLKEIAAATGQHFNNVAYHVKVLVKQGVLEKDQGIERSIRLARTNR